MPNVTECASLSRITALQGDLDIALSTIVALRSDRDDLLDKYIDALREVSRLEHCLTASFELEAMLRLAAEDDYRKRVGFLHTIKEDDVQRYIEALQARVRAAV